MYISIVTLYVDDIDRAVDFYTKKLGWNKTMDVDMGEGMRWVTVGPSGGQAQLTLSKAGFGVGSGKAGESTGIILEVDDVYKTAEQLKGAGVEVSQEPRSESWGGWAMFKDSEGNEHGLHSPVPAGVSAN